MERRKATIVKEFNGEEVIVSMLEFNGKMYVATNKAVYVKVGEELIPVQFVVEGE